MVPLSTAVVVVDVDEECCGTPRSCLDEDDDTAEGEESAVIRQSWASVVGSTDGLATVIDGIIED